MLRPAETGAGVSICQIPRSPGCYDLLCISL